MSDNAPVAAAPLHPAAGRLADACVRDSVGRAVVVRDDARAWLAIEESVSGVAFVEAQGDILRVVPFLGDPESARLHTYVASITPSWVDGADELAVDLSELGGADDEAAVLVHLDAALRHWSTAAAPAATPPTPDLAETEPAVSDLPDFTTDDIGPHDSDPTEPDEVLIDVQLRADISDQWSWASSSARIPQIFDLTIHVSEPVEHARITATVSDADLQFGTAVIGEGAIDAGTTVLRPAHVPLSARAMSLVDERRGAECVITVEDVSTGRTLARYSESLDIQPRDLWLWQGDPRRAEQRARMELRYAEVLATLAADPDQPGAAQLAEERDRLVMLLRTDAWSGLLLGRSLLAAFVRPNHPEVAAVAREAADVLGQATGDPAFQAFQIADVEAAEQRADATVDAIWTAVQARHIAYSDPPPGWDFTEEGQRIRDHGEVARGGLATCMDTTVLLAAVIEHVGLLPVLVLVPGHIFVGYWRRDPHGAPGGVPEWYPDAPFIADATRIRSLVDGGYLGVIETTMVAIGSHDDSGQPVNAAAARRAAHYGNLPKLVTGPKAGVIDVAMARRAGVSPLPAVTERADGAIEIIEYRPGGAATVTEVPKEERDLLERQRQVDTHPARYRTWKSSLFSLNATNALLNLGNSARVQPIILPGEGVGVLEDRLHQGVSFSLNSGYEIPEVWAARGLRNAIQLTDSGSPEDRRELLSHLDNRRLFIQRIGRSGGDLTALSSPTFLREIKSMAHAAKTARDERGMNPLFLCIGMLRWPYKDDTRAEAPLILVPVSIAVSRGRGDLTLSLDASQQTTPNAALIEWLRREHGLSVPELAEPLTDSAGIDVDETLRAVRAAIAERGLDLDVRTEARLAILDLSAFRMWQDLNAHADVLMAQPLVRHLVETPTEAFVDPAVAKAEHDDAGIDEAEQLEGLDTPIPADATQRRAVRWARQGRTFVLQGPPGTGKSQTITNMVAECVMSGMRVLFVAEKGTALAVVQRRLDDIGLGSFTLNLHHEGSNASEVRNQLKRALDASVTPDPAAVENVRRRLRNTRFELAHYPQQLHETNAAGLSAYSARDQLLVLGEGTSMVVPTDLVAREADQLRAVAEVFDGLQQWISRAGARPGHPWRLAGPGDGDPFDVEVVRGAVLRVLDATAWTRGLAGPLGDALRTVAHPAQLATLASATDPLLPTGDELTAVLHATWPASAASNVAECERSAAGCASKLRGFAPDVISMDLRGIQEGLGSATQSGFLGRGKRETAAIAPLVAAAPAGLAVTPESAPGLLADLIAAQDACASIVASLRATPGLVASTPANVFSPGALAPVRDRLAALTDATSGLRGDGEWGSTVRALARDGLLAPHREMLVGYGEAWHRLLTSLMVDDADFEAWRAGRTLVEATDAVSGPWRHEAEVERLLPLQQWCTLMRRLEPLRAAGLASARTDLLEGTLRADVAEDAFTRGVARAALDERVSAAGLDRFDAAAHDDRIAAYSTAQRELRKQWVTDGPAALLERRGGGGAGAHTGGLARELEKTTRKLGTRPILRKYGAAVQELTPLVLCSPSSVVDLIEPGVMEFDVVIFDEASQITVPEAVGALGRAAAAIVVGDTKQMPPTRKVGGGTADDEADDEGVEEIVEDQESILSECELARVPTLRLSWHYRSQDEALIAFSNRTYYRGALSSFPTPTLLSTDTGVEFRRVEGQYLRAGSGRIELDHGIVAGSNTNPVEAQAIVDEIHRLVHAKAALPSVGIVTFNEQQRTLIDELLHASDDPRVADVMDEAKMGRGEALFVKALEQVQGDERDIIIFSVAFSKQANGKIPTNFGPLSNAGGERRLNVAITRARRKNVVFCSFDPSELDVSASMYNGPKDLKEFLVFAKASGASDGEAAALRTPIRDRHRDEIAEALRAAGLHVLSDVGLSNFRIDLVLARADRPERPLLPVLLDGESWRKRDTVSDRDVLPVDVLTGLMGWPLVARIWWPMWVQNRDVVIEQVLAEVSRAEAELDARAPAATAEVEPADPDLVSGGGIGPAPETSSTDRVEDPPVAASLTEPAPLPAAVPEPPVEVEMTPEPAAQVAAAAPAPAAAPPAAAAPVQPDAAGLTVFVPAPADVVGPRQLLDALHDRASAATVREQVLDVIENEGPIEVNRLTRIVARRFGLGAVRAARAQEIAALIPRAQLSKRRKLGDFAWPRHLDPATWTGFRVADANGSRTLDEIAPEEIANAMRYVQAQDPDLEYVDDILRRTAELFGIVRLGANVRSRLEAVYSKFAGE